MSFHLGGLSHLSLHEPAPPTKREEPSARVQELEQQVQQLTLVCMAMWSLLRAETRLTEEDLLQRVRDIDLMDGVPDGKVTPQVARCGNCHRVMSPRHQKCIYCGQKRLVLSAFDPLV